MSIMSWILGGKDVKEKIVDDERLSHHGNND